MKSQRRGTQRLVCWSLVVALAAAALAAAADDAGHPAGCATILQQSMYKSFYDQGASPDAYAAFSDDICGLSLTSDAYPALPVSEHPAFTRAVSRLAPNLKSTRWTTTAAFLDYWAKEANIENAKANAMVSFKAYAKVRAYILAACKGLYVDSVPTDDSAPLTATDFDLSGTVLPSTSTLVYYSRCAGQLATSGLQLLRSSPVGGNPFVMQIAFDPDAVAEPASDVKAAAPPSTIATAACNYVDDETGAAISWADTADRSLTLVPGASYTVTCAVVDSALSNGRTTAMTLTFILSGTAMDGPVGYTATLFHGLPFPPPPPMPPSPPPPPPRPSPPPPPRPSPPPPSPPPTCESKLAGDPCFKLSSLESMTAPLLELVGAGAAVLPSGGLLPQVKTLVDQLRKANETAAAALQKANDQQKLLDGLRSEVTALKTSQKAMETLVNSLSSTVTALQTTEAFYGEGYDVAQSCVRGVNMDVGNGCKLLLSAKLVVSGYWDSSAKEYVVRNSGTYVALGQCLISRQPGTNTPSRPQESNCWVVRNGAMVCNGGWSSWSTGVDYWSMASNCVIALSAGDRVSLALGQWQGGYTEGHSDNHLSLARISA